MSDEELEQTRVQLAGCGVAALGGTRDCLIAKRGSYGWSASYQDVLDLRKKYDSQAKELHELRGSSAGMSASEGIYGFAAWLTTRDSNFGVGASCDAGIMVTLVKEFCNVNNLAEPRDGGMEKLIHPKE